MSRSTSRILQAAAAFGMMILAVTSSSGSSTRHASGPPLPSNGPIIVSTRGDNSVILLDPLNFAELDRAQAPIGLHEIAASPDGRRAVGAAYGSGPRHQTPDQRLLVIGLPDSNPATDDALTIGAPIDLGSGHIRPNDLIFLADSRHVLCTSEVARCVVKVDLDAPEASGSAIVREYPFNARAGHMLAVSPDYARAYIPSVADRTVSVIDLETGEVLGAPEAGQGAEGIAASPDGSCVWIACNREDRIVVLDTATNQVEHSFDAPGFPFRVRFTPDASRVVVSFPNAGAVRVFDASTREVVHTIDLNEGSAPTSIAVSPDGRLAAVVCAGHDSIAVFELSSGQIVAQVAVGPVPDGLAWAPSWEQGS